MKLRGRIFMGLGCVALLLISWAVVILTPSSAAKQASLIEQAQALMADKIYISSAPLLEEAVEYGGARREEAENLLKQTYLALIEQPGYQKKYLSVLGAQMGREDAKPEAFAEAADFYLGRAKLKNALSVLKDGIEKTGDEGLRELYERERYRYKLDYAVFQDVTAIYGKTVGVCRDGAWGLARANGTLVIPCVFERISTYSGDRVVVKREGEIFAVDQAGNRIALLKEPVSEFGNYADGRLSVKIDGQWRRASGDFAIGSMSFEELGTYSNGYVAAKTQGKWGVVDIDNNWMVPAEYDGVVMDELGRCLAQDAVFVRKNDQVQLLVGGKAVGEPYEDARPFQDTGYAAVKRNGKWGFIDPEGNVKIDFTYDDAHSFGMHLASVQVDGLWGYISLDGNMVIDPVFLDAKSFCAGSAPVQTERGWQFMTLLEYEGDASL